MSIATERSSREERSLNPENWKGHEDQINQVFSLYRNKVNPLVAVYNSVTGEFPIGVMNELRDIFSHLVQSLEDPAKTGIQLDRAQSHCKRAAIDGFKYAAMAYSQVYEDFKAAYQHVDLSYVNDGRLLPELTKLSAEAGQLMTDARLIEARVHDEDEMYEAYEAAFNRYFDLYECIMDAMDAVETLSMRAEEDEKVRKKERRTDRIIGIVGVIFGIIGVAINFL